jgi:hypothetical protein
MFQMSFHEIFCSSCLFVCLCLFVFVCVAVSTDEYVTDFKWASNKYQEKLTLSEIASKIYQVWLFCLTSPFPFLCSLPPFFFFHYFVCSFWHINTVFSLLFYTFFLLFWHNIRLIYCDICLIQHAQSGCCQDRRRASSQTN